MEFRVTHPQPLPCQRLDKRGAPALLLLRMVTPPLPILCHRNCVWGSRRACFLLRPLPETFTPPMSLLLSHSTLPKCSLPGSPELCSTQQESMQPAGSIQQEVSQLESSAPSQTCHFLTMNRVILKLSSRHVQVKLLLKDVEETPSSHSDICLGAIIVY